MSNKKTDSEMLLCSPRKHRTSRKRQNQDDVREYRHVRWDWRACYRDHDSFMNTLRWMHSRMRTPISEESETESLTDTASAASVATEPLPTTSLSEKPIRKKHSRNTTCRSHLPALPKNNRGAKSQANSFSSPRRILSEPVSLQKTSFKSVSKRCFEPEGVGETVVGLSRCKEMKILPLQSEKSLLSQGHHLSKNGSLLTQVASVWSNAVFCNNQQSENRPLVASCGKMATRLATNLPISPLDANPSLKSYFHPISKLSRRTVTNPTSTTTCSLPLQQSANKLKLPPICPAAKYPNILPSWRL